jgi:hypothetical protein
MNKHIDDPKKTKRQDVVPVAAPELPAVQKPINKTKLFRKLVETADELVDDLKDLEHIQDQMYGRVPSLDTLPKIRDMEHRGKHYKERVQRCEELIQLLDPESNYDDPDYERLLNPEIVRERLAWLVGSKHIGSATTPEAYLTSLLNYVADEPNLDYLTLEGACRELETETKWLPDISEVLKAIRKHYELWNTRLNAIWYIEKTVSNVIERIKELTPQAELMHAKAKLQQAESKLKSSLRLYGSRRDAAIEKQEAARKAAQEVEAAMAAFAEALKAGYAALGQAVAAIEAKHNVSATDPA